MYVLKPETEILAYWQGEEGTKVLQNLTVLLFPTCRYALTEAARQCQVETIDLLLQEGFSPFLALPDLEQLCSSLCPTLVTLANQGFFTPVQKLIGGLPITDKLWCSRSGPRLLYVLASQDAQHLGLSLAESFVSFLCKSVANWEKLSSKSRSDVCMCLKQLQNYNAVFRSVHHPQLNLLAELVTFCNQQTFGVDHLGFVFHTLCGLGNIGLVQLMLENASDVSSTLVNKLDSQKRSPLFHAALGGHLEIIHLLIDECCIVYSNSCQPPILALILYFALAQFSVEHLGDICGKVERSTFNERKRFFHHLEDFPTHLFSHAFQSPDKCDELVQLLMPPDTSLLQELLTVTCVECQNSPVHLLWLISSCHSLQPLECFLVKVATDSLLSERVVETALQFERPTMWRNNYTVLDDAVTLAPTCSNQSSSVSFDSMLAHYAPALALHQVKLAAQKGYWGLVMEAVSNYPRLQPSYTVSDPDLLNDYQWVLCRAAKLGRTEILSSMCRTFTNANMLFGEQCGPLCVAVRHNHLDAVDILVEAGDALDMALEAAVKFGRTDALEMLLNHVRHDHKGILSQSVEKLTSLAGRHNQTDIIKLLLAIYEDMELMIGCDFPERTLSFWFLILLEATRHGHENLGLQAVACISETQMKEVAQHSRYKDVLYWCCYWGMFDLLECIPFTSAQLLQRTYCGTSPWECAIANGQIGKLSYLSNFPKIPDRLGEWLADGPLHVTYTDEESGSDNVCDEYYASDSVRYSIGLLCNGFFHRLCSNEVDSIISPVDSIIPPVTPLQESLFTSMGFHNLGPNVAMLVRGIALCISPIVKAYLNTLGKYAGKVIELMHHHLNLPLLQLACMTKDGVHVLELLLAALSEAGLLNDMINSSWPAPWGYDSNTPLSLAVRAGSVESAQLLLRCDPDSMIHFVHPLTADTMLHLAVKSGDAEMVTLVMKSLGDAAVEYCFIPNKENEYPLYLACALGNCETVPPIVREITDKGKPYPQMSPDWKPMALRAIGWFNQMMKMSPKSLEYTPFNSSAFSLREIKGQKVKDVFRSAVHYRQKDMVAAILFISGANMVNAFLPDEPEIILNSTVFDFCFGGTPIFQRSNILAESDFTSAVCAFTRKGRCKEVVNLLELIQTNKLHLRPDVTQGNKERVFTLDMVEVFLAACCQKQLEVVQYLMNSTYPPIVATLNRPTILKGITAALACGCLNSAAYLQLESGLAFEKGILPKGVTLSPLTSFIFFDTRDGYFTVIDQFFESVMVASPTDRLPISAAWITHSWTEYECQLVMKQLGGNSAPSNPWNVKVADGDGYCTLPINIDWESFHECLLHSPQMDSSCMKYTPLLVEAVVFSPAVLGQIASSDGNPASVNVLELLGCSPNSTPSSLILSCVTWPSEPSTSTTLGGHALLTLRYMPKEGVFVFPTSTGTVADSFADMDDSGIEYSTREDTSCYLEYCRDLADSCSKSLIKGFSSVVVDLVGFADVDNSEMFTLVYPALQLVLADCSEVLKLVQRSSVVYSNLQDNAGSRWLKSVSPSAPYDNVVISLFLDVNDSEESPTIKVSLEDKTLTLNLGIKMPQFPVLPSYELLLESVCSCIVDAEVVITRDKFQSLISRVVVPKLKKSLKCTSLDADFFVMYLCDKLGNTCRLREMHAGHLNLMKSFPKFRKFLSLFSEMLQVLSSKPRLHSSVRHLFDSGCKITFSETGKTGIAVKAGVPSLTLSIAGVQKATYQQGLLDMFSTLVKGSLSRTQNLQDISVGIPAPFACHVNLDKSHGLLYPVLGFTGKLTLQLVDYSGLQLSSTPTENCHLDVAIKTPSRKRDISNSSEKPGQCSVSRQLLVKATGNGEFEVEWTPEEDGLHYVFLTVNGIPIDGSPFKALVANHEVPPTDPQRRSWFLHKGSSGSRQTFAGSPLVFIASHSGPRCNCHTRPPNVVLPQRKPIRPLPSPAITSGKATPSHSTSRASLESLTSHPLHHITVCATSGNSENWLHIPSGPVTLYLARDSLSEDRRSRIKQKKRLLDCLSAHCLPLGNGLYRVSLSCTLACTFKLFTACATCQAVMSIHWIGEKAVLPATCYVLPGPFCNKRSILSSKRSSRTLSKSSSSRPGKSSWRNC